MRKKEVDECVTAIHALVHKEVDRCISAIHALIDEISKLQKRVRELEEHHIHHQDVYQAGSTGEPVFNQADRTEG